MPQAENSNTTDRVSRRSILVAAAASAAFAGVADAAPDNAASDIQALAVRVDLAWASYAQCQQAEAAAYAQRKQLAVPVEIDPAILPDLFVQCLRRLHKDAICWHRGTGFVSPLGWKIANANETVQEFCPPEAKGRETAWISRRWDIANAFHTASAEAAFDPELKRLDEATTAAFDLAYDLERQVIAMRPTNLTDLDTMARVALRWSAEDPDFSMPDAYGPALAKAIQALARAA